MVARHVSSISPPAAAEALKPSLTKGKKVSAPIDCTIADAAEKSGLPLRDAEQGLHHLLSSYRGHLRVTSEGELLFRFPNGFTRPWETKDRFDAFVGALGRGLLGVGRFIVRAWIAIVLIGYALLFLALMIGLMFARSSDSKSERGGGVGFEVGYLLLRAISEALFWTFHPFSPVAVGTYDYDARPARRARRQQKEDSEPFYEKVNRFFFGPQDPPPDPRAMEKAILAEIRAQKGRIGLGDVMRVTGLPRDQADPLMARLMLDYEGTVEVSDEGGIAYRFESMRKTIEDGGAVEQRRAPPIWSRLSTMSPLTGNGGGTNFLIIALNGFNLLMSYVALTNGWTIEKLSLLLSKVPLAKIPDTGTAIALGVVPLVFSIALFLLPIGRALLRPLKQAKIARENGRKGMLREVLTKLDGGKVTEESLSKAWTDAAGSPPPPKELTRQVVALGGDVEIEDDGQVRYRFPDLEAENRALKAEREAASEEEAAVGKVVFSSEN
ncbi:MAG: hypothetical protein U0359_10915 [Byssovorax sp.]